MHNYYRILDRFDREVASLAIYSGNDLSYCPDRYEYQSLETSNVFQFKTYQIKGQDVSELEKSDNPFAMVILTVFVFLQKKHKPQEELLQVSLSLARRLFRKGFSREKIDRLLTFLKTYVNFENPEMFAKFDSEIDVITNKKWTMGINELVIQLREEAATERGLEKGLEQGLEKGLEQGLEKGKAIFVRNLLLKTHHSIQEIAELADAPLDFVIEVKNKLSAA